jgi:hypothetical protein
LAKLPRVDWRALNLRIAGSVRFRRRLPKAHRSEKHEFTPMPRWVTWWGKLSRAYDILATFTRNALHSPAQQRGRSGPRPYSIQPVREMFIAARRHRNPTNYAIAGICAICGTGLFEIIRERRNLAQRRAFATEFRSRFTTYANNSTQEFQTYKAHPVVPG